MSTSSLAWPALLAVPLWAALAWGPTSPRATEDVAEGRASAGESAMARGTEPLAEATAAQTWLVLPEVMEPAALQAALLDQPESWSVFDVRPESAYREYHVPGAIHAPVARALELLREVPAGRRIVLVDRDGTQAYAVAGAAHVALGERAPSLRVLAGGTARYWREIAAPTRAPRSVGADPAAPTSTPLPSSPSPATSPAPTPARPRSAGC